MDWSKVPPQDRRLKPNHVTGRLDLGELGITHSFSFPVRTDSAAQYLRDVLGELLDLWRKEVERLLGDLPPTISKEALVLIESQVLQDLGRQIIKERRERPTSKGLRNLISRDAEVKAPSKLEGKPRSDTEFPEEV